MFLLKIKRCPALMDKHFMATDLSVLLKSHRLDQSDKIIKANIPPLGPDSCEEAAILHCYNDSTGDSICQANFIAMNFFRTPYLAERRPRLGPTMWVF